MLLIVSTTATPISHCVRQAIALTTVTSRLHRRLQFGIGMREIRLCKSYPSHALRHRLHVWATQSSHLISQVADETIVAFTQNGPQRSHKFLHCLLLDRCRHLAMYRDVHGAMITRRTTRANVLARPVVRSVWLCWECENRSCKPSSIHVLRVTVAHVIPEVVFPPEDLAFVYLQADKTNVVQSIIPMCHTMSKKGIPPSIRLFTPCLNTSPCFV